MMALETPALTEGDCILLLSARTSTSLAEMSQELGGFLEKHPEFALRDVAYTLQTGRHRFNHRRTIICSSRDETINQLKTPAATMSLDQKDIAPPMIWLLPAEAPLIQGWWQTHPVFREALKQCLGPRFPDQIPTGGPPALFLQYYALGRLIQYFGLQPQGLAGRGCGELAAAALAGLLHPDRALLLVTQPESESQTSDGQPQAEAMGIPFISRDRSTPLAGDNAYWRRVFQEQALPFELSSDQALFLNFSSRSGSVPARNIFLLPQIEQALAQLVGFAIEPDWKKLYSGTQPRRVPLPAYRFERHACWFDKNHPQQSSGDKGSRANHQREKDPEQARSDFGFIARMIDHFSEEKIDNLLELIQQIPAPSQNGTGPSGKSRGTGPQPRIEEELVDICRDLLGIDEIGISDNIILMGGDSIFAMQLSKRVQDRFGVEISPHHLFREPTLESLARSIRAAMYR